MAGVRVGDYFGLANCWGKKSKEETFEPRFNNKDIVMQRTGERIFLVEGTASTKAWRQE